MIWAGKGGWPLILMVMCPHKQDQAVRWSRNRDNRWTSRLGVPGLL
jgi:hypothetical protein